MHGHFKKNRNAGAHRSATALLQARFARGGPSTKQAWNCVAVLA
jgi:hypothetical protein